MSELEALRAENRTLRDALQAIAQWPPSYPANANIQRIREHARAALNPPAQEVKGS